MPLVYRCPTGSGDRTGHDDHHRSHPQRRRHRAGVRDARCAEGPVGARAIRVPRLQPLDRRPAQPLNDPSVLGRRPGGHLARAAVRGRRQRAARPVRTQRGAESGRVRAPRARRLPDPDHRQRRGRAQGHAHRGHLHVGGRPGRPRRDRARPRLPQRLRAYPRLLLDQGRRAARRSSRRSWSGPRRGPWSTTSSRAPSPSTCAPRSASRADGAHRRHAGRQAPRRDRRAARRGPRDACRHPRSRRQLSVREHRLATARRLLRRPGPRRAGRPRRELRPGRRRRLGPARPGRRVRRDRRQHAPGRRPQPGASLAHGTLGAAIAAASRRSPRPCARSPPTAS